MLFKKLQDGFQDKYRPTCPEVKGAHIKYRLFFMSLRLIRSLNLQFYNVCFLINILVEVRCLKNHRNNKLNNTVHLIVTMQFIFTGWGVGTQGVQGFPLVLNNNFVHLNVMYHKFILTVVNRINSTHPWKTHFLLKARSECQ